MKIEIWGSYPPPIGGVSIHLMRFIHEIKKHVSNIILKDFNGAENHSFSYIIKVENKLLEFFFLFFKSKRVIHLHSNRLIPFFLMFVFGRNHIVGITVHNKNLILEKGLITTTFLKLFLNKLDFIILNDSDYGKQLVSQYKIAPSKIHVVPAYIKPSISERKGLKVEILKFRKKRNFVISANAFKLRLYNGVDVYGLDLLIDLIIDLKKRGIDVGLIFCLPQIGNVEYYDQLKTKIKSKNIQNNILIIEESLPNAFEIWEISDLFIRPTLTDIEGLSVKEALDFKTNVIASNVCKRPKEVTTFENRNYEDLLNKVLNFHNLFKEKGENLKDFKHENSVLKILEIYRKY